MRPELIALAERYADTFGLDPAALLAFVEVETGGRGFDPLTGKIIIQFEPAWFKKKVPYAPSGAWSVNKVERQRAEWSAFNDAFSIDKKAAMESTSIGLGQIMGFHWKRLGYASVRDMWDDAKKGVDRQIWQMCRFISTDIKLRSSLQALDWDGVAVRYNGAGYKELAKKIGREPYDISMAKAYQKYSTLLNR